MTLQEFRNILAENQHIVIIIGIGFLFLVVLIYLFLRTIFSTDAAQEIEADYRRELGRNVDFSKQIDDEDLTNYVVKLKGVAVEGSMIAENLERQVAERGKEVKDMEIYINQLKEQEETLLATLNGANIEPVPLLNTQKMMSLQKKARRKANLMLWVGLLLGILLGVVSLTGYAHFILKVSLFKVWW
jgi:hypothetical protein